ncbi:hypothetical protein RGQ29_005344 [Quercus rubra]|uniref:NmrA-like domain-containing protein n=1 Tax=Quercus rubra TaxID=3512 RepID=A0AAN7E585_QUERU|nr:hypothetical protein RGQ29_005344 [Quercus rubra]
MLVYAALGYSLPHPTPPPPPPPPQHIKIKILVIGGTGYIGKFIVEASAKAGHPTFVLVLECPLSNHAKSKIIHHLITLGAFFVFGDLYDHGSLVRAIKEVEVVISTIGYHNLADQDKIITAIKEAGNVKRFFPSEFGSDSDRCLAVDPVKTIVAIKSKIHRTVAAEKIPYTIVCSNCFSGFHLPTLAQIGASGPHKREEEDSTYTIRAGDDPRTLNKKLYIRPPGNICSFNDLLSLWEKKIGKTLKRIYLPEEQLLKNIKETSPPINVYLATYHSVFMKGDQTNFEIEPLFGVEATQLYPDVKYTPVDEFLDQFV